MRTECAKGSEMTDQERIAILDKDAARIRARKALAPKPLPPEALEAFRQLERERILAGEPEPDPESTVEILARQRRWFASQRQLATQWVDSSGGYFPNPTDRETQIESRYLNIAAAGFYSSNVFANGPPATIEDLVKRTVDAENEVESITSSTGRIIEGLRDEILDLQHQAGRKQGGRN
jgi:hypothetical protein